MSVALDLTTTMVDEDELMQAVLGYLKKKNLSETETALRKEAKIQVLSYFVMISQNPYVRGKGLPSDSQNIILLCHGFHRISLLSVTNKSDR